MRVPILKHNYGHTPTLQSNAEKIIYMKRDFMLKNECALWTWRWFAELNVGADPEAQFFLKV